MGTGDGKALQISCREDWQRVHALREICDGVAVGAKTWIGDRPRLTVRREVLGREPCRQPARVIFAGGRKCEVEKARRQTFLIGRRPPLLPDVVSIRCRDWQLSDVLGTLHGHGVGSLLVEGGRTLLLSFLHQGIFDRLTFYISTRDGEAARLVLEQVFPELPEMSCERFGEGTLLSYSRALPQGRARDLRHLLDGKLSYIEPVANGGQGLVLMGPVPLPILLDKEPRGFEWYVYGRASDAGKAPERDRVNSALVYGDIEAAEAPLVRIHSGCHTGDIFSSLRCDCGAQLERSLGEIVSEGAGVAIYIAEHEGRGIGLWAKAMAYLLQDQGRDTFEANRELGFPDDARCYDEAAAVLARLLRNRRIRLLSNNPEKRAAFKSCGFTVLEMKSLVAGHNPFNQRYIEAKHRRGHLAQHSTSNGGDSGS